MLENISETYKNIESLNKISNKSSLFNDSHLKLNNLADNIKNRLNRLQEEIEAIENTKMKNFKGNSQHKQSVNNIIDLVKSKLFRVSEKFKKSLKMQSQIIRQIEERRSNLTQIQKVNKNTKKNPFVYSSLPNDEHEINDQSLNVWFNQQKTDKNVYYQERSSAVEKIERTMHELSGMFSKMANCVNEAQYMIERIEQNTDSSLNNIEKGYKEASIYEQGIKSNKALLLKIFFILVFFSVLYLVFLS